MNRDIKLISTTLVNDPMFTPEPYYMIVYEISAGNAAPYKVQYYEHARTPLEAESAAWFRAAWRVANA